MTILFGALIALVFSASSMSLRERGLQAMYGTLSLLTLAWLALLFIQAPGHEAIPLLLLGVLMSGTVRGEASRVLILPVALLLPLALATHSGAMVAVNDPWRALGMVSMGAGVGFSLRFAWLLSERSNHAWFRAALLGLLLAAPGLILVMGTPATGVRAWNFLLPMTSVDGTSARVVALQDGAASAWPWLEPLAYALPIAIAAIVVAIGIAFIARPTKRVLQPFTLIGALLTLVVFIAALFLTPGAWSVIEQVDPQMVVDAIRPPFVPHDATTYLSPQDHVWQISRAGLALWLGLAGWIASTVILAGSRRPGIEELRVEHAAVAPLMILVGGLFFAESWSAQAIEVASLRGTQGLIFSLAALAAAGVLLRGRLRTLVCVLVAASSTLWLAATIAQKVLA